jgi:hypothetical protein
LEISFFLLSSIFDTCKKNIVGYYSSILSEFIDPGFMSVQVSNKESKTIGPPGKPEGNTTHGMHCALSPKITLMGGCKTQVFTT